MILVTAAAGRTGSHVLDAIEKRGLAARAMLRRKRDQVTAAEQIVGDMLSKSDWKRACAGIRTVIHTGPASADEPIMGRWAIEAAKAAGVEHFIYISVAHPQTEWLLNHQNKRQVENVLIDSGIPFTILQPMHYYQNIDVAAVARSGVYASPYSPTLGIGFVDMADLAEVAAKVADEPGHAFATYEICGRDYLNAEEVAAILSERLGRTIANVHVPVADFVAQIPGTDGWLGEFLLRLMTYYNRFGIRGNANVLTWLLGREPTDLRGYIARMQAGAAPPS